MTGYESEDDSSDVECPTCGRDDFADTAGMKNHHAVVHGESIAGVLATCDWCGSEFRRKLNELESAEHHFCDLDCKGLWASENRSGENNPLYEGGDVEIICAWCGDTRMVRPVVAARDGNNFCSRQCSGKYRSKHHSGESHPLYAHVTVTCPQCGGEHEVKPHVVKDNNRHFCSRECMGEYYSIHQTGAKHPGWKGGVFPYGEGWTREKRREIRERQGRCCAGCGVHESEYGRKLSVHHIVPARTFDDAERRNHPDNLVALCQPCHHKWEGVPLRPQIAD